MLTDDLSFCVAQKLIFSSGVMCQENVIGNASMDDRKPKKSSSLWIAVRNQIKTLFSGCGSAEQELSPTADYSTA